MYLHSDAVDPQAVVSALLERRLVRGRRKDGSVVSITQGRSRTSVIARRSRGYGLLSQRLRVFVGGLEQAVARFVAELRLVGAP